MTAERRLLMVGCVPALLAVGLITRFALDGWVADASGGVFYTALIYVLLAIAKPRAAPATLGLAALGFSIAIELFQLTPVPAELADAWSPFRLVLGTSFAAADLGAYVIGAAAALAADRWMTRTAA
jgi:hypothetical protein